MDTRCCRLLLLVERTSWACGLAGVLAWAAFHIEMATWARHDLARFAALQAAGPPASALDQSLWSAERIMAWQKALSEPAPAPLAVLRIPKIGLEVPVLPGTDDRSLDRAVGHIKNTAHPGTDGNSGIAGHRDGFFRGLKDIALGDVVELDTLEDREVYRVEETWVVTPEEVWVLRPTATRSLTLVTCYPFYFIGPAPRRFIVRAVRAGSQSVSSRRSIDPVPCPQCGRLRLVAASWSPHAPLWSR